MSQIRNSNLSRSHNLEGIGEDKKKYCTTRLLATLKLMQPIKKSFITTVFIGYLELKDSKSSLLLTTRLWTKILNVWLIWSMNCNQYLYHSSLKWLILVLWSFPKSMKVKWAILFLASNKFQMIQQKKANKNFSSFRIYISIMLYFHFWIFSRVIDRTLDISENLSKNFLRIRLGGNLLSPCQILESKYFFPLFLILGIE